MTHDPFQNYQTLGAYSAGATPFGLPYTALQPSFNPVGLPQQIPGIGGYNPIQAQLGLLQQLLQNPLVQHALAQQQQTQWQNPQMHGWPQQQLPYNYPLAPQGLIGGAGIGQPYGQVSPFAQVNPFAQINPLAQFGLRPQTPYGFTPSAGF